MCSFNKVTPISFIKTWGVTQWTDGNLKQSMPLRLSTSSSLTGSYFTCFVSAHGGFWLCANVRELLLLSRLLWLSRGGKSRAGCSRVCLIFHKLFSLSCLRCSICDWGALLCDSTISGVVWEELIRRVKALSKQELLRWERRSESGGWFSGLSLRPLDVLKSSEELLSGVLRSFLKEMQVEWSTKLQRFLYCSGDVLYLSQSCAKVANHEGNELLTPQRRTK